MSICDKCFGTGQLMTPRKILQERNLTRQKIKYGTLIYCCPKCKGEGKTSNDSIGAVINNE